MVVTRLKPMLKTVVRENSSVKQCKEVHIECDDLSVEMDVFQMRQALDNLMDNAVILGKCDELVISAHLKGASACLTVADDGCGMTENQCQHAFDRYYTPMVRKIPMAWVCRLRPRLCEGIIARFP